MKAQFISILQSIGQGKSAALQLEIDGQQYTRNYLP